MENICGIYEIRSKCKSNRHYIGSSVNIKKRWNQHKRELRTNSHGNKRLQNHYNKYTKEDLVYSLLVTCSPDELIEKEQFFIDAYNPYFNICKTAGNCLGLKASDETRERISKGGRGLRRSDEARRNISKSKMGHPYYGLRHHSDETKEKMSKSRKLRPPATEEQRRANGERKKGNKNMLGKHHSEESRRQISESRIKNHDKISASAKEMWRKRKEANRLAEEEVNDPIPEE